MEVMITFGTNTVSDGRLQLFQTRLIARLGQLARYVIEGEEQMVLVTDVQR